MPNPWSWSVAFCLPLADPAEAWDYAHVCTVDRMAQQGFGVAIGDALHVTGVVMMRTLILGLLAVLMAPSLAAGQGCTEGPVSVQVLGSGGPRINPFRSSASYLLWIDNQSKIL